MNLLEARREILFLIAGIGGNGTGIQRTGDRDANRFLIVSTRCT